MPKPLFSFGTVFQEPKLSIASIPLTAATTLQSGPDVIPVNGTAGAFAVTLPLANHRRGRELWFVKTDAVANVTIQRQGADVIGYAGGTSVVLTTQDQVLHLVSDGATRWIRLGG